MSTTEIFGGCVRSAMGSSAVVMATLFGFVQPAVAISLNSLTNFNNLSNEGWSGLAPLVQPDGGPLGVGDPFLRAESHGGASGGSRMAIYDDFSDWTGDYATAGVTAVAADMANLGSTVLSMRIVLFNLSSNRFTSTISISLPADGQWHHLTFPIDSASLTRVSGSLSYTTLIHDVSRLMFRHDDSTPSSGGTPIVSSCGFDNIRAVPAPGTAGVGLLAATWAARRARRVAAAAPSIGNL